MISNSIKITLRKLQREKLYALINIAGLAIAIACCVILGLYLRSELTYDRHTHNYQQIYRVVGEYNANGKIERMAQTSPALHRLDEYEGAPVGPAPGL